MQSSPRRHATICISYSFDNLRQLSDTFVAATQERFPRGAAERRAIRMVVDLGDTAVPLLTRKLRSENVGESSWAYTLLSHLGGARVVDAARTLALDANAGDEKKALALALLSELGAEIPETVTLRDPHAVREGSVRDLLDTLDDAADVARAADLLLQQMTQADLPAFLSDLVDVGGSRVAPLLDEFLLRDDVSAATADHLVHLRDRLPATTPLPKRRGKRTLYLGERPDGHRTVLVLRRHSRVSPPRLRALVVHVDPAGALGIVRYEADVVPQSGERRLIAALVKGGYALAPTRVEEAGRLVGAAARRSRETGKPLAVDYYLGRDLLDLTNEHARNVRDVRRSATGVLAEACSLLGSGQADRAHDLAQRYVEALPDDAEGHSVLGASLLALERETEALFCFEVAARLEPDLCVRSWNLAQAATRSNRLGAAYLALCHYVRTGARSHDAPPERMRVARHFAGCFERFAQSEHPDCSAELVARAEELFERAHEHLTQGRATEAISGFEAVLKLVPSHYPSWGNLGAAYLAISRAEDAEYCLHKALAYRPDYEPARKNLIALHDEQR